VNRNDEDVVARKFTDYKVDIDESGWSEGIELIKMLG